MSDNAEHTCTQDWGLPDWRDPSAYPDRNIYGWCWEFLRRSPEYRSFWEQEVLPIQHALGPLDGPLITAHDHPSGPRISDGGTLVKAEEAERRFGLWQAYDPRRSQTLVTFTTQTECWAPHGLGDVPMLVPQGRMAILFNPALPIEPQVERAKATLLLKQQVLNHLNKSANTISREIRPRIANFANYLRVLDAKEAGVPESEIASVLLPRLDKLSGVKNVKNHYAAAKRIRDGGFRKLVIACLD